ncbi:MAG: metallophosphoesterase [Thermomicrobiales bacterium]
MKPLGALAALAGGALAAGGAIAWHSRHRAPLDVQLRHIRIGETLPDARELRLAFVTDTHIGPTVRAAQIDRALALVMAEQPDLLLLGGDFISESPRYIPEIASVIGAYTAQPPLGAISVFGNHDYANDAPRLERALTSVGVQMLRNEAARLEFAGSPLWIAGIDDAMLSTPDIAQTFANIPASEPTLALWHEPDGADQVAPYGALAQFSGHSHGGQVRLPGIGHIAAPSGGKVYVSGLYDASGMPVYTSHGVGAYRPPLRYRCAPEVTLASVFLPAEPSMSGVSQSEG